MWHLRSKRTSGSVDRIIALGLALLFITACDKNPAAPVATGIGLMAGGAQTGTVNAALVAPVTVQVTDQSGNPLAGAAVIFTPTAASGSVSATAVTTGANGDAQVSWTLGTAAGTDSLTAALGTTAVVITATASPDVPATLTIVGGDDQSAAAGTSLSGALAVRVTDRFGNVVPGVMVQWADDAGGTLGATTSVSDVNGVAQDTYMLGGSAGSDDVIATIVVNGATIAADFVEQAM